MEVEGEIVCSVEKWCSLVDQLTPGQRDALLDTGIHCMLQIPPIKMRKDLIRYMVEIFDPKTHRFVVKDKVGFTATTIDVESIYGLKNRGLCATSILDEEFSPGNLHIPQHFLCKRTNHIVINNLITNIVQSGSTDDDFVRMTSLVLLGTVLAPHYLMIVPRIYYILVQDVDRFKELNLNEFTLVRLFAYIRLVRHKTAMSRWPGGNVSLLQVHMIFQYMHPYIKILI